MILGATSSLHLHLKDKMKLIDFIVEMENCLVFISQSIKLLTRQWQPMTHWQIMAIIDVGGGLKLLSHRDPRFVNLYSLLSVRIFLTRTSD